MSLLQLGTRSGDDPIRIRVSYFKQRVLHDNIRFSLDKHLTSLQTLRTLIARAFNIQFDTFLISYRFEDNLGHETYLELQTDDDLKTAFERAADPLLYLRLDPKPVEATEEWDIVTIPPINTSNPTIPAKELLHNHSLPTKILTKVEKTINLMQQVLNISGAPGDVRNPRPPLGDAEFIDFRDGVGNLVNMEILRQRIFEGGLEPSLRRIVWKHILNIYPTGLNGRERMQYVEKKSSEYYILRKRWETQLSSQTVSDELKNIADMVKKDVLRTDRHYPFYSGDDNPNVNQLFNVLTTYSVYHNGYCQGMSDIASPLLYVMKHEAPCYLAFCALMERLKDNFCKSGVNMTMKFSHLTLCLKVFDSELYQYLTKINAIDLLFCYRWLLLEMKREFPFEDSLKMLEVSWSCVPLKNRESDLPLFERMPLFESSHKTSCTNVLASKHDIPIGSIVPQTILQSCDTQSSHEYSNKNGSTFNLVQEEKASQSDTFSPIPAKQVIAAKDTLISNSEMEHVQGKIDHEIYEVNDSCSSAASNQTSIPFSLNSNNSGNSSIRFDSHQKLAVEETSIGLPQLASHKSNSSLSRYVDIEGYPGENGKANELFQKSDYKTIKSKVENCCRLPPPPSTVGNTALPPPHLIGNGNPFLIFMCLSLLLQHRDIIINRGFDYNELAMHFDRQIRKHNVEEVLKHSRTLYYRYLEFFKTKNQR